MSASREFAVCNVPELLQQFPTDVMRRFAATNAATQPGGTSEEPHDASQVLLQAFVSEHCFLASAQNAYVHLFTGRTQQPVQHFDCLAVRLAHVVTQGGPQDEQWQTQCLQMTGLSVRVCSGQLLC